MQLSLGLDPDPMLPQVRARLLQVFGPLRNEGRHDPTSQFVKSLISSRTRDAVRKGRMSGFNAPRLLGTLCRIRTPTGWHPSFTT